MIRGAFTNLFLHRYGDTNAPVPHSYRASGGCVCKCGKRYDHHPMAKEHLDFNGEPFLNRLCNGDLVKL